MRLSDFFILALCFIAILMVIAYAGRRLIIGFASSKYREIAAEAPATAMFGLFTIAIYFCVAVLAGWLAPYPETAVLAGSYEPWSASFLLGTDSLGRDILSRILLAARTTMGIALVATLGAFVIGTTLGLAAATYGRKVDLVLSRLVDAVMAIPPLILALLLLTVTGPSIVAMVVIVAGIDATRFFRLSRAVGLNIATLEYVEAARLRGEGGFWIMRKEMLPNMAMLLGAETGLRFCFVFLKVAALSFIGLGIQPPAAEWGSMVRENASLIAFGDATALVPALCIAVLAISANFLADWLLHLSRARS
jgi:peptide/nickel transport system permease protein